MGEWEEWQVLSRDSDKLDRSEMAAREQFLHDNPPISGLAVPDDLHEIELVQRPWRNNKGRWFELAGNRVLSAHLAELSPGGNSVRHRHTTEAYIYIVMGRGFSIVNYEGEPEERIEWSEGSLFSPPVWAWHQHFNSDREQPARYLAIQDTGLVRHMRLHNIERHPTQRKIGDGTDYVVDAVPAEAEAESAEVQ
jgi:quercetin dioxygenase-like cupin family protein